LNGKYHSGSYQFLEVDVVLYSCHCSGYFQVTKGCEKLSDGSDEQRDEMEDSNKEEIISPASYVNNA
jgi:hypothetical protein